MRQREYSPSFFQWRLLVILLILLDDGPGAETSDNPGLTFWHQAAVDKKGCDGYLDAVYIFRVTGLHTGLLCKL